MFLFAAFALIGLLWWYARRVSHDLQEVRGDLQELRGTVREHGSRLSEVEGHIKMLQRPATVASMPRVQPHPAEEPAPAKEEPVPLSTPPPLPTNTRSCPCTPGPVTSRISPSSTSRSTHASLTQSSPDAALMARSIANAPAVLSRCFTWSRMRVNITEPSSVNTVGRRSS